MIISDGLTINRGITIDPGPIPVPVVYLIVAGGGGGVGLFGTGCPGGGAGGFVAGSGAILYNNVTYAITVGAGGPTNTNTASNINLTGSNSSIVGGDIGTGVATPDVTVYTTPDYLVGTMVAQNFSQFLIDYAVWVDGIFYFPTNTWVEVNYLTEILVSQEYTLRLSAHSEIELSINGTQVATYNNFTDYSDTQIYLDASDVTITCRARSTGQPSCFAAALYTPEGVMIWSTRSVWSNPLEAFGGGGGFYDVYNVWFPRWGIGYNGGSGAGEIGYAGGQISGPGAALGGQGHNGGAAASQGEMYSFGGGGGGGAGAAGAPGGGPSNITYQPAFWGGDGGVGLESDITGTNVYYAGGGGGSGNGSSWPSGWGGEGGQGGGGQGGGNTSTVKRGSTAGQANTGGGGGGNQSLAASAGGSGIVIIKSQTPALYTTGNPVITDTEDGYTVYQFLQSGTIRF